MAKAWFSRNLLTSLLNHELHHQSTTTPSTSPTRNHQSSTSYCYYHLQFTPLRAVLPALLLPPHFHLGAPITPQKPPQDHLHLSTTILFCHHIHLLTQQPHALPSLISTFTSTKTLSCYLQCSTTTTMAATDFKV